MNTINEHRRRAKTIERRDKGLKPLAQSSNPARLVAAILLVLALTSLIRPARAQTSIMPVDPLRDAYPTVAALVDTLIPPRDRVDLARRLRGLTAVPAPPLSPPVRQVGEQEVFWMHNPDENRAFQITTTLRVVGDYTQR